MFNAGLTTTVRPSNRVGGTLRLVRTSDFDSLDPGNTYYAFAWNFLRLTGRTLVTFRPAPGAAGQELVPDLATTLGIPSDDGATWTYRLRRGVRYEDGGEVVAADIRNAIERSNFRTNKLSGGPMYFRELLRSMDAVETPDDVTIVFRLAEPFAGMDFLATLPTTTPVPAGRDHAPPASGPYRVHDYRRGSRLELVRNPHWDPASDPVRRALPDRIVADLGVEAQAVDDRLLDGSADIDLAGVGVHPETLEKVTADTQLRTQADNPYNGFTWLFAMSAQVPPFDDVHCRRAVQYATDKAAMQAAYGGPLAGDIASTLLPPTITGHEDFDLYPNHCGAGDLKAARAELAAAHRPSGFTTRIAAREDRCKEYSAAIALAAALAKIGIEAEVIAFQSGEYFEHVGVPEYLHEHGIGIVMFGWGADFPDGFGFLHQIVHGSAIKAEGNHNFGELDLPEVNALLDHAARSTDADDRTRAFATVDRLVMENASIVPYLHAKSLLFRGHGATNVYVSGGYGMYDYAALGVER